MKKIKGFDLRGLNNGAHFQFMKAVTEQLATETEINKNAVAKAAVEALAAMARINPAEKVRAMSR